MPKIVGASPDAERRRRAVASALGSLRIEGIEIGADARAIADRYIAGEITVDELVDENLRLTSG